MIELICPTCLEKVLKLVEFDDQKMCKECLNYLSEKGVKNEKNNNM